MKTAKGWVQGDNAQAVVSEDQIILAGGLTQEANDVHQLKEAQGAGRFMVRGLTAYAGEWTLHCVVKWTPE